MAILNREILSNLTVEQMDRIRRDILTHIERETAFQRSVRNGLQGTCPRFVSFTKKRTRDVDRTPGVRMIDLTD